jgi:hypothetical protein
MAIAVDRGVMGQLKDVWSKISRYTGQTEQGGRTGFSEI